MDPRTNPYAPGAGTRPPELAGRQAIIEQVDIALDRIRAGRSARSVVLVGLRGVGKTVLLRELSREAAAKGIVSIDIESPEDRSLPALLIGPLRSALLRLNRLAAAGDLVLRGFRVLGSFASAFKAKYKDVEFSVEMGHEPGQADSGDLEEDLRDVFLAVGAAAQQKGTAVVLFIDELQYVPEAQLSSLISALHACAQNSLPLTIVGAGLPQLIGQAGKAKSYAERLFEFCEIGPLLPADAQKALREPVRKEGVEYTPEALAAIVAVTRGYPYFLQEWGAHAWDCAAQSPINLQDVHAATEDAIASLDDSFFRVRLDRLAQSEKRYLRAMAENGPGPHRSGEIAATLGLKVESVAPVRSALIRKGMIYSLAHGENQFTVPLFDAFMLRAMPQLD
jgi:hypothetical protein